MKGRDREGQGDTEINYLSSKKKREIFHLLIYFPNGHSWEAWTSPKPGTWNSSCISHVDARHLSAWASISCFLGTLAGGWIRSSGSETSTDTMIYKADICPNPTRTF